MERQEVNTKEKFEANKKINDAEFCEKFRREWEEVTSILIKIQEENEIRRKYKSEKKPYKPTSSSVVFY